MKTLPLSELFDPSYGNKFDLNKMSHADAETGIAFVSRTRKNLGVVTYVDRVPGVEPFPAGHLTMALGGVSVLETFVQPRPFYTAQNVAVLKPKGDMSDAEKYFYCLCIKHNRHRYNGFGREANRTFRTIPLPSRAVVPNWVHVERDSVDVDASSKLGEGVPALVIEQWKPFKLKSLFEIKKGKRLTKARMSRGAVRFIGAIDGNNGVSEMIAQDPIHSGNTITVNYNGSVAEAFYQPEPFWCSDDVNVLYPKFDLNPRRGLFLCTIIRREKYRFSYGRKWHMERMNETMIRLPAGPANQPDWEWIDDFVDRLPYSKALEDLQG